MFTICCNRQTNTSICIYAIINFPALTKAKIHSDAIVGDQSVRTNPITACICNKMLKKTVRFARQALTVDKRFAKKAYLKFTVTTCGVSGGKCDFAASHTCLLKIITIDEERIEIFSYTKFCEKIITNF